VISRRELPFLEVDVVSRQSESLRAQCVPVCLGCVHIACTHGGRCNDVVDTLRRMQLQLIGRQWTCNPWDVCSQTVDARYRRAACGNRTKKRPRGTAWTRVLVGHEAAKQIRVGPPERGASDVIVDVNSALRSAVGPLQ
jgi:hypothetical protein